jgi:RNA polymerase sigma factor (sigma-70 family)
MNENEMVKQHLGLVKYVLTWFNDRDNRIVDELNSEGLLGLLKAIRTHDETKGKFQTFAIICIRNAMIDHLRKEDRWGNELIGFNKLGDELPSGDPSAHAELERYQLNEAIRDACGKLTEREERVLTQRLLSEDPLTHECLAQYWKTSEASIRRDEARLKSKIKENFDYAKWNEC